MGPEADSERRLSLAPGHWVREGGTRVLIPEVARVFPHVHAEVVLPLGDVAAFGAHVILGVGVGQHVLGQVAHVSTREVTQLTLVRLLACGDGGERGENTSQTRTEGATDRPPQQARPDAQWEWKLRCYLQKSVLPHSPLGRPLFHPDAKEGRGKVKTQLFKSSFKVHSEFVIQLIRTNSQLLHLAQFVPVLWKRRRKN